MSATITAQFIRSASAHRLSDDMVSVELVMGDGDTGYGGSVGIVCRGEAEARRFLDAAQAAVYLLTGEDQK